MDPFQQQMFQADARQAQFVGTGGNKYRIVVWSNYPYRIVYIRFIGIHMQYDGINAQSI